MSAPAYPVLGRFNAVSSLFQWILDNVASPIVTGGVGAFASVAFTVAARQPILSLNFASGNVVVALNDLGHIQDKAADTNDVMAVSTVDGSTQRGRWAVSLVSLEFGAAVRTNATQTAEANGLIVRDVILNALRLAGRKDDSGAYFFPAIAVRDFVADPNGRPATNNFIEIDWRSAWIAESPIRDREHPELRIWRVILRMRWPEIWTA